MRSSTSGRDVLVDLTGISYRDSQKESDELIHGRIENINKLTASQKTPQIEILEVIIQNIF